MKKNNDTKTGVKPIKDRKINPIGVTQGSNPKLPTSVLPPPPPPKKPVQTDDSKK